jgi:hypothetical protein
VNIVNSDDPANQTLKPADVSTMEITCAAHGKRRWKGDVVCTACGRIYDIRVLDKGEGVEQTVLCRCRQLLTSNNLTLRGKCTARVICYNCARHYRKRFAGVVPRDRLPAINAELAALDAGERP